MFRLMPKQQQLLQRFEQIAELGLQAAGALNQLLKEPFNSAALLPKIEALEQQADDENAATLELLQKGTALPFDKSELIDLLGELDDLVDGTDLAAHRLLLYRVQTIKPEALKLGEVLTATAAEVVETVRALRTAKDKSSILARVAKVNELESQGDAVLREAIGMLFAHEQNAIELIKWKELFEILEDAIDTCEHVAERIKVMVLKSA